MLPPCPPTLNEPIRNLVPVGGREGPCCVRAKATPMVSQTVRHSEPETGQISNSFGLGAGTEHRQYRDLLVRDGPQAAVPMLAVWDPNSTSDTRKYLEM